MRIRPRRLWRGSNRSLPTPEGPQAAVAGPHPSRPRATPIEEGECARKRKSSARALLGEQDAVWLVGKRLPADLFEVGQTFWAKRDAQLDDRQIRRARDARDSR